MANELQPHQQRVVDEKNELDEKLTKLIQFIEGRTFLFANLSDEEAKRLRHQAVLMRQYSSVLADRISAFGSWPSKKTEVTSDYSFSWALSAMKSGVKVRRQAWDSGMYVFKHADGMIGCIPTATDMLAEDWEPTV